MEVSDQLQAPAALPQEKCCSTHWIVGEVGPMACLDGFWEGNISFPYQDSTLWPSNPNSQKMSLCFSWFSD
jgi:hypothetical protein